MTGTEVGIETVAQRIASAGHAALVERMRTTYRSAAAAHADLISLDGERIEAMVQAAAGRADGLQWRRALADVASSQLGISATEALSHPAVARAQVLVGAPSYEQSLAELIASPVPQPDATAAVVAAEPPPEPIGYETQAYDVEAAFAADPAQAYGAAEVMEPYAPDLGAPDLYEAGQPLDASSDELSFGAIHEGGVANLPKRGDGLGVHISAEGLDIYQGEQEIIGRLLWDEIETLQVVNLRPRRRRPETARCRLIVRTPQGDASFAVPDITGDELRSRIEPLLARYGKTH